MRRLRNVPYAIGEPGRLASEVRLGVPLGPSAGSDIELAEHDIGGAAVRAATVRGLLHRNRSTERQDAFACAWDAERSRLLIAVADGVGSRSRSREASTAAVRVATEAWANEEGDLGEILRAANDHLLESIPINDAGFPVGGTTLTLVEVPLVDGEIGAAKIAWVGDSPVWLLSGGKWSEVAAPGGEGDAFAAPIVALPSSTAVVQLATTPAGVGGIFVMTDGVGVPLRNSSEVQQALAAWWAEPPGIYAFGAQVEFARQSFQDDRTVVGVWAARPPADSGKADTSETILETSSAEWSEQVSAFHYDSGVMALGDAAAEADSGTG